MHVYCNMYVSCQSRFYCIIAYNCIFTINVSVNVMHDLLLLIICSYLLFWVFCLSVACIIL